MPLEPLNPRVNRNGGSPSGLILPARGEPVFLTLTGPGDREHVDPRTGDPCACTRDGGVPSAEFNAGLPTRWNRFAQDLKRLLGMNVAYFRAVETQRRGCLHEHVLIVPVDPSRRMALRVGAVRALAIKHGYGHSVRLDRVHGASGAASYVAKYVSKSCDERPDVPWVDLKTGELIRARYRPWSASRNWGARMLDVRAAQRAWARARSARLDNRGESYTGAPQVHLSLSHAAETLVDPGGGESDGTSSQGAKTAAGSTI